MSNKTNPRKIKIIQFKDIVSLSVLAVMVLCSVTYSFGAVLIKPTLSSKVMVSLYGSGGSGPKSPATVTADDLLWFNREADKHSNNADNIMKDNKIEQGKFKYVSIDTDKYGWKLVNFMRKNAVLNNDNKTPFYASTFIKEDENNINLVIAYANTSGNVNEFFGNISEIIKNFNYKQLAKDLIKDNDLLEGNFDDIIKKYLPGWEKYFNGNWEQDFIGSVLLGYTGSEGEAIEYATTIAKHFSTNNKNNKKITIHVTGHSLGGYLAQVGGAALLQNNTYKGYVKQIGYFNAMGLHVNNKYLKNSLGSTRYNIISKAYTTLKNNKKLVTSYQTRGDWCSGFGEHVGSIKEYYIHKDVLSKVGGVTKYKNDWSNVFKSLKKLKLDSAATKSLGNIVEVKVLEVVLKMLGNELGNEKGKVLYKYASMYNMKFKDYIFRVHDFSAFNGWNLSTENREADFTIKVTKKMPSKLQRGKNITVKFKVIVKNGTLPNEFQLRYLSSDPTIQLGDLKLAKVTTTKLGNNGGEQKVYEYQFNVKALIWNVKNPKIYFLANTFYANGNDGLKELVFTNNKFTV